MKNIKREESKLLTLHETKLSHKKEKNDQILYSYILTVISLNIRRIFYIIHINVRKYVATVLEIRVKSRGVSMQASRE